MSVTRISILIVMIACLLLVSCESASPGKIQELSIEQLKVVYEKDLPFELDQFKKISGDQYLMIGTVDDERSLYLFDEREGVLAAQIIEEKGITHLDYDFANDTILLSISPLTRDSDGIYTFKSIDKNLKENWSVLVEGYISKIYIKEDLYYIISDSVADAPDSENAEEKLLANCIVTIVNLQGEVVGHYEKKDFVFYYIIPNENENIICGNTFEQGKDEIILMKEDAKDFFSTDSLALRGQNLPYGGNVQNGRLALLGAQHKSLTEQDISAFINLIDLETWKLTKSIEVSSILKKYDSLLMDIFQLKENLYAVILTPRFDSELYNEEVAVLLAVVDAEGKQRNIFSIDLGMRTFLSGISFNQSDGIMHFTCMNVGEYKERENRAAITFDFDLNQMIN